METVPVTADNIEIMETAAGFLMPEEYVDHWLDKGSRFFAKDDLFLPFIATMPMEKMAITCMAF